MSRATRQRAKAGTGGDGALVWSDLAPNAPSSIPADRALWRNCLLAALVGHAALLGMLLPRDRARPNLEAGASTITVDIVELARAASAPTNDHPVNIDQPMPTAPTTDRSHSVTDDDCSTPCKSDAILPSPNRLARNSVALLTPAPSATPPGTDVETDRPPGQVSGLAPAPTPVAITAWQRRIVSHLERFKRYPREANGAQGVARVAFTMDRAGKVVSSRIAASSGSPLLDDDAEALLRRAQPLPIPPGGLGDDQLSLVAPISYVAAKRK